MAIEHQVPDRPPLDLGGSYATAINAVAYARLCQALGLPARSPLLREQTQSVTLDEDLRQILGVDTIGLYERPHARKLECPRGRSHPRFRVGFNLPPGRWVRVPVHGGFPSPGRGNPGRPGLLSLA